MEISLHVDQYRNARLNFYKWRNELEFAHKIMLAFAFACLTGLLAQMRFMLPWTPVPVTGQTFAVLLSAVVLGRWGGISQGMYLGLGVAGVPWFAGGLAGLTVLTGATGGYLLGFLVSAFVLGHYMDSYVVTRKFTRMLPLMIGANFGIVYGLGLFQLYLWLTFVSGDSVGLWQLLTMGAFPFIAGDLAKIVAASAVGSSVAPKQAFGSELDA